MDEIAINRELRELKNDRILNEKVIKAQQSHIADMLKGDMGKDMHNVLSGKTYVKLSLWEKIKYKFNKFIDNILSTL